MQNINLPLTNQISSTSKFDNIYFAKLLPELTKINKLLNTNTDLDSVHRRFQFLIYEFNSLQFCPTSNLDKIKVLNEFIFQKKHFVLDSPTTNQNSLNSYLIEDALKFKKSSPHILSLIYSILARELNLEVAFVDLKPQCFLKVKDSNNTYFIDLSRYGQILSSQELLEKISTGLKDIDQLSERICEVLDVKNFLITYLKNLRKNLSLDSQTEDLLKIQNELLQYLPTQLNLIGERALIHYKLNMLRNSILDLKRYFAFQSKENAPTHLVKLYQELTEYF